MLPCMAVVAGEHNFCGRFAFRQGDTWKFTIQYTDDLEIGIPIVGVVPKMQVRKKPGGIVILDFNIAVPPLTGIVLRNQAVPANAGFMDFYASSVDTAVIKPAKYYYDIQFTDAAIVPEINTFLYGEFNVVSQVTV